MKNALITGTTSGIGKAFAEKFASVGNNVILVARDEQKLNEQQLFLQDRYNVTVKYIAYDLTREDAVYSATKAYIMSFSNALSGEYSKTGIKITTLCPGATKTEFATKANLSDTG